MVKFNSKHGVSGTLVVNIGGVGKLVHRLLETVHECGAYSLNLDLAARVH